MSERVTRSRELVARGFAVAAVARVLQISRQALYRVPTPRAAPQRRPVSDPVDVAIVEVAKDNPTDGYRMVAAWTQRKLGVAVNRKRVLRVMREQRLIQRRRSVPRRRRPGFRDFNAAKSGPHGAGGREVPSTRCCCAGAAPSRRPSASASTR